jgi:hypothetical protein
MTITLQEIKDYLGIAVDTYDTQITANMDLWYDSILESIIPSYLTDTSIEKTLKLGSMLIICGNLIELLPSGATSYTRGSRTTKRGDWTDTVNAGSSSSKTLSLTERGEQMLEPYLSSKPNIQILDAEGDSNTEFTKLTGVDAW